MEDRIEEMVKEFLSNKPYVYWGFDAKEGLRHDLSKVLAPAIADEANKQGERTATGRAVKIVEEEIHKLRTIPKEERPGAHTVLALVKRDIENNVSK